MPPLDDKEQKLHAILKACGRVVIGFSGGVDSTLLLRVALDVLGKTNVLAVLADTPSLPRKEYAEAMRLADSMDAVCVVVFPDELSDPNYVANPANRCYFCKKCPSARIAKVARENGFACVLDGNNADDNGDYRPGRRAALELGVKSPLMDAGLTKAEIRELSARAGLPTANKPAMACLASRIPYGTAVTAGVLAQVERAEEVLRQAGFVQFRVRHHGDIARIEVAVAELPRLIADEVREKVVCDVKAEGYRYVTLDLQGYRMGSLNERLGERR